ncbi:MAG: bifunctional proline dehydrogenase/L-glutamate gamma-semialdehyde dehydrogenase PutA [Pseudomonadales bacterium]|jgi:RHH-type proline utilization regulon transcriptional repressor/proline dehydrogenase/delta 1-pyrroline-5-carboxylate dehydrogenase|nr:bifunctional proline dehydrogenase/L-glutamate gamma-semialdehyde dehydrogenase PutA [Gammaproteobacteria bacterium]MBK7169868.1 bifunctional proline dehydrogenase/L-glutamate gamma-semialdehyde dehydrogenase PutA [Gammaproteobacteria bacterium]MBK9665435.1 bifunctional proline dehydrogenase/L-glutamate gamma-semialdehyde dehydrogenase PutA [Gammaproteobacteria bacterium]MBP6050455.1 bifunctional proline dehydrogenase/L-glutamate gamma-semialdehyde dehydrogenase PutA [Pseudomonadales bacteriu
MAENTNMLMLPPVCDQDLRRAIRALSDSDEGARVAALLAQADAELGDGAAVAARAAALIEAIREKQRYSAGINALLTEYSLSSREGVVLMCLAEALLRVPDRITADRLIRDKLGSGDWRSHVGNRHSLFVNASAWGLLLTGKVIRLQQDDTESAWRMLRQTVGRAGEPAIRTAMRLAMNIMGTQFVLGTDIDAALDKSKEWLVRGYRYSYDMLGEGARTATSAGEYHAVYCASIERVGQHSRASDPVSGPGFSVKLSALHPRLELAQGKRTRAELVPRVLELAQLARAHNIGLTLDAEEAHRLDPMLDVFEAVYRDSSLSGWEGFGMAVQAYLKNAPAVIDWLADQSARQRRRIMVRLVKGAYWDAEIKHAQNFGLAGYPVFTRKAASDLSYLVCAGRLLAQRSRLYPQFATHNAHSASAILAMSGTPGGFEFQRLHGMGEELYEEMLEAQGIEVRCRIYAPVGVHRDLLAYLVRRLLENGANSSFVHNLANKALPSVLLGADPRDKLRGLRQYANRSIALPRQMFGTARAAAHGVDLQDAEQLRAFASGLDVWRESAARLGADTGPGTRTAVRNPANREEILGHYTPSSGARIEAAAAAVHAAERRWAGTPAGTRADCLRRAANQMEAGLAELAGFCIKEAGKTVRDALADVREAIDFCRYYALEAETLIARHGHKLEPRGPILCISPWNFPVAIFVGQLSAALVSGNPVIAKPAEQTTLVALRLVEMFHAAGVPADVLQILCGPGAPVGDRLLGDPRIAGVMFTGSTAVATHIAKVLAARGGARAMLIAETGGQNALVVDSSALPEQVVDDVIASGFNSAGQRCSALRVLCVQHEIAERLIAMLRGAMQELRVGDPADIASDIGPIIDEEARARLEAHVAWLEGKAKLLHACTLQPGSDNGSFFAPRLYEIDSVECLREEVFGPVVHLVRYRAADLEQLPQRLNAAGFGLTFGIHSRVQRSIDMLARDTRAGNVYVNRNMIGAVVGVQPFGGQGLSGTGPKAGGPLYLPRLMRVAGNDVPAYRAIEDSETPIDIAEVFDCRLLLAALAELQHEWSLADMRTRFAPARALREQITHNGLRDHDQRVALGTRLHSLLEQGAALAQALEMPGPTGETNTLSFEPRGVLACVCRDGARESDILLPALAALLCGNTLLFLSDAATRPLVMTLRNLLGEAGFADGLSAHHTVADMQALGEILRGCAIDGVLCHGDAALSCHCSRSLAAREGAILPLIDEDFGPLYLQRFVHEKTVSVNTTASGGNTALMSQSESD